MTRIAVIAAVLALVAGCASTGRDLKPGETRAQVEAAMGKPTEVVAAASGDSILFYSKLPGGRAMYAATIGPDGKLRTDVEQRLVRQNIRDTKPGMTAKEVRERLGPPYKTERRKLPDLDGAERDIWTYPWRDVDEVRLLTLQFDTSGVLKEKNDAHDDAADVYRHLN